MQSNKTLPLLAVIMSLLFAPTAVASNPAPVYIETPKLRAITFQCLSLNDGNHTIKIDTGEDPSLAHATAMGKTLEYRFRNAVTHQILKFTQPSHITLHSFPLPQGKYDLTVGYISSDGSGVALPNSAQVQYKNITVPQVVSTGGRGTGCAFA